VKTPVSCGRQAHSSNRVLAKGLLLLPILLTPVANHGPFALECLYMLGTLYESLSVSHPSPFRFLL